MAPAFRAGAHGGARKPGARPASTAAVLGSSPTLRPTRVGLYAEPGPSSNGFTSWEATAVARAADGKIVVGGTAIETSDLTGQVLGTDLAVARLLPDGTPDPALKPTAS